MNFEIFPPTESELDQMILDVQKEMESAKNQLDYDQLHDKLKELRKQRQELIISNNAL